MHMETDKSSTSLANGTFYSEVTLQPSSCHHMHTKMLFGSIRLVMK